MYVDRYIYFGFFFNILLTLLGYLMPTLSMLKNSIGTIKPIADV